MNYCVMSILNEENPIKWFVVDELGRLVHTCDPFLTEEAAQEFLRAFLEQVSTIQLLAD